MARSYLHVDVAQPNYRPAGGDDNICRRSDQMVSRPTRLSSRGTGMSRAAATTFIQRYQRYQPGPQKKVYLFLGITNSDVRPCNDC